MEEGKGRLGGGDEVEEKYSIGVGCVLTVEKYHRVREKEVIT